MVNIYKSWTPFSEVHGSNIGSNDLELELMKGIEQVSGVCECGRYATVPSIPVSVVNFEGMELCHQCWFQVSILKICNYAINPGFRCEF